MFTFEKPQRKVNTKRKKNQSLVEKEVGGRQYNCTATDFLPYRKQKTSNAFFSTLLSYYFFIIVTEVANAVRLGVYVMRVPTITRVLPCQIL